MQQQEIQLPSRRHMTESIENLGKVVDYLIDNPEKMEKLPKKMVLIKTKENVPYDIALRVNNKLMLVNMKKQTGSLNDLMKSIEKLQKNIDKLLKSKTK